jgi:hypothetical protein
MKLDRTRQSTRIAVSTVKWSAIALAGLVSILVLAGLAFPGIHIAAPDMEGSLRVPAPGIGQPS